MSIDFKRIFKMKLDELRTIITEAGGCGNASFSDSIIAKKKNQVYIDIHFNKFCRSVLAIFT